MTDLDKLRGQWTWRGHVRPAFAEVPAAGQESVWDYPRPPKLEEDSREILVLWGSLLVAKTRRAIRVLETSHPPTFYLPWDDVARDILQAAGGGSLCEWKGPASYWTVVNGPRRLPKVAWSYPTPLAGAEALAERVAFYPGSLECRVDGALATPQPGGFYGGWVTPDLAGPFKGSAGTSDW
jgi:uncharacterized protein (DUF427 family)